MNSKEADRPTHVFVVGTGRSGTTTLSDLLSSVPGCAVEHERTPKLLDEVKAFVEGSLSRDAMVDLLRRTRAPSVGYNLSGESNTQLSFVLPLLAEAFPSARVIWLMRDGRDVVASMVARGIYHPRELEDRGGAKDWARARLQADRVGDLSSDAWERLDPFGRCCWLWSFTQRVIGRDLARLSLPRIRIRLEGLAASRSELAEFCGLPEGALHIVPHSNRSARTPRGSRAWSGSELELFRQHCGPVMNEHYPGWEEDMKRNLGAEAWAAGIRASSAARAALGSSRASLGARLGLRARSGRNARH
jgi:hypothetical protein